MLAFIGGSGFTLQGRQSFDEVETPYGKAWLTEFRLADKEAIFLPRHGPQQRVPPHRINYRANLWVLKEKGVSDIFAAFSVGSLNPSLMPGALVLLDQFVDFTKNRPMTFSDEEDGRIVHIEMTYPYCSRLRQLLSEAAGALDLDLLAKGTYVCVEGPRFETAAEIAMFGALGGDVVGMTGVPEVVLARELGICFAGLALVTNLGAGLSAAPPSHREVIELMGRSGSKLWDIFEEAARRWSFQDCSCRNHPQPG
jgi:5'-methylthioadenosine phosphorylase